MKVQGHFGFTNPYIVAATLFSFSALGADAPPSKTVAPRADILLQRMSDFLAKAKFFSVKAEVWQDIDLSSGQRVQAGRTIDLQVRRPNRLRANVSSTRRSRELVYDGNSITLFNRKDNLYGTVPVSGPLDQAMDVASDRFGIPMPLEDFVSSDPHRDLLENTVSGRDIGPVTVMGVPCEHLAFSADNIDWQVWIQDGPRPVPRKFVITYRDEPNDPQYTAVFSNWDFNTELPDFVFSFEPPQGAAKIPVMEIKAENLSRQSHRTEGK
jgi:hypothetical protein